MNRLSKYFLLFFSFLCLTHTVFAQGILTREQKELMGAALNVAVGEQKTLPDYADFKSKKKIVLYNKMTSLEHPEEKPVYLTEKDVPELKKVKFLLQNEVQIMDTTRTEDLLFVRVAQIAQPEREFGVVTVMAQIALGTESRAKGFVFKQTKAQTMFFKKTNGSWTFERILTTFPNFTDFKDGF
jgi:hypothetical protein